MPRWLCLLVLLPQTTGCLAYAYPELVHTPELAVENRDMSVHAFRVDIDRTEHQPQPTSTEYTLTRIPLDTRGQIPSQLELAGATGVYNPFGVVKSAPHERTEFTMLIRVYRPGYRTIEVGAWERSRELQWVAAKDLLEQEKAIDDLLADPAMQNLGSIVTIRTAPPMPDPSIWWQQKDQKSPPLGLQPGQVSSSQRKTLEFAASEYSRLASSSNGMSPANQAIRERLQQKAIWLQRYAVDQPKAILAEVRRP